MTASISTDKFDIMSCESLPHMFAHMKQLAAAFLTNSDLTSVKTPSSILSEAWVRAAETVKDVPKTEAVDERLSLANALYGVLRDHAQQMREASELESGLVPAVPAVAGSSIKSGQIDIGVRKHL